MQLMHDENWLYRSSSWADCLYSPCSGGVSFSRIIHGLILTSFSMKSSMSTTRSLITGKLVMGSTVIVRPLKSWRTLAQVSWGSPTMFAPQLPPTALLHDQRYVRHPSISPSLAFRESRNA